MSSVIDTLNDLVVVIPAVKKNVAFPDDLVKKLAGRSLIQRAIDLARKIIDEEHILIFTDSEEISLIAERNGIGCFHDSKLYWDSDHVTSSLFKKLFLNTCNKDYLCVLSPYAPLINITTIRTGLDRLREKGKDILIPVRKENRSKC